MKSERFIEFYKRRNTTVFVTFLDASKAFDRIDHWRLYTKLIDKHFFIKKETKKQKQHCLCS